MKRFLDFLTNSTAAVALAAIVVVGLVLFLIPPLHPFAWVIGIVVCLGAAAAAAAPMLKTTSWSASMNLSASCASD
ncbi:hypothetical protein KCW65_23760, partial [Mycobacterium tuberculosis]|nr:hypothetical protein [Mycobacterium tuberculosis]